jgi:4-amino-4-deoxy-L-arabinose transferase-like glycosyltransferase
VQSRVALALALAAIVLGIRFGTFVAGGADPYGYVSQADLWLRGTLIIEEPLAREAPWRDASWSLTPLGYRPAEGRMMVPTYSPGLPMVMAAFKAVGGENAVYLVVPLLGGLSIWLTYLLGTGLGGPSAGAFAALLLLVSPAFLFQLMWPMSDVPAMAWWLVSIVLALRASRPALVGSGLAAAFAILTRPNLIVLVVPLIVLIAWQRTTWRDRLIGGLLWSGAASLGAIADALVNRHLYGSAIFSGYGTLSSIYSTEYFSTNLTRYPLWLLQTQSPFILLGLAAPIALRRLGRASGARLAWWGLAFTLVVLLSYLWYTPFENWTYLRFLLPAYPVLIAMCSAAFVALVPRGASRRRWTFIGLAAIVVLWGLWEGRIAFRVRADEARYRVAARFATGLPENAVIISNQHSGSLRYYANRLTVRFEWLYPDVYVEAVRYLNSLGRPVFAVLDDWERDVFRARYAGYADLSWLDEPPLVLVADGRVYFYAVSP